MPPLGPEVFASECGVVGDHGIPSLPGLESALPFLILPNLSRVLSAESERRFPDRNAASVPFLVRQRRSRKIRVDRLQDCRFWGGKELGSGSLKIFSFSLSVSMPCET